MYFLLNMGIFQCHVSFRVSTFWKALKSKWVAKGNPYQKVLLMEEILQFDMVNACKCFKQKYDLIYGLGLS